MTSDARTAPPKKKLSKLTIYQRGNTGIRPKNKIGRRCKTYTISTGVHRKLRNKKKLTKSLEISKKISEITIYHWSKQEISKKNNGN